MTRQTFVRWTCNVCETQRETATDKQPKGWVGYGFTQPNVPNGEKDTLGHLCGTCAGCVMNAMNMRVTAARPDTQHEQGAL